MDIKYYRSEWLPIVCEQEKLLRLNALTDSDALCICNHIVRLAQERYRKPVSIRIIYHGQVTLSLLMNGTDTFNEWWMDKKLNVCQETRVSSLRSLIEIAEQKRNMPSSFTNDHNYALCGGCFPIRDSEDQLHGWIIASGMTHWYDHQIIADALAAFLNVRIPEIRDDRNSEDF